MSLPDWSALLTDILQEISVRVCDDADYVRFRSVCTSWRSAAVKKPQIPWLVASYREYSTHNDLGFCNFPKVIAYCCLLLPQGLSVGKLIVGSSRGWIALIDGAPSISLHNPFTHVHVSLPVLDGPPFLMDHSHIAKMRAFYLAYNVVLSSDPTQEDCVVMAIAKNRNTLISCKPRDSFWTRLPNFETGSMFTDIIFYKNKFHVVSNYRVFVYDPTTDDPLVTEVPPADPFFSDGMIRYSDYDENNYYRSFLVVSSGDLLLVAITCPHSHFDCYRGSFCNNHEEFTFEVFRIDLLFDETPIGKLRLVKLESLDSRSLFLGKRSMSVSISMENSSYCRGNCIYLSLSVRLNSDVDSLSIWPAGREYFLGDNYGIDTEEIIVVFNMEDGNISWNAVFSNDRMDTWASHWLTPRLCS